MGNGDSELVNMEKPLFDVLDDMLMRIDRLPKRARSRHWQLTVHKTASRSENVPLSAIGREPHSTPP